VKSEKKWGYNQRAWGVVCPACKAYFVNRQRKRCPQCKVALYVGTELLYDKRGYWMDPHCGWIPVTKIYERGDKK